MPQRDLKEKKNTFYIFKKLQVLFGTVIKNKENKKQTNFTIAVFEKDGNSERADLVLSASSESWVHCAYNTKSFHHQSKDL